jgi:hypothetical protein
MGLLPIYFLQKLIEVVESMKYWESSFLVENDAALNKLEKRLLELRRYIINSVCILDSALQLLFLQYLNHCL